MSKPELGTKRLCGGCGAKFYDLNKDPITCPKCGKTAHAAEPRVSVRAMILSLGRFEIAPKEQVKALEKAWAKYRELNELDIEGKRREISTCHYSKAD